MTQKIIIKTFLANVASFKIEGNLWTDTHGNTVHSCYVSVLLKGENAFRELGYETYTYGYDNEYEQTALKIIRAAVEGFEHTDTRLHIIAADLGIHIDSSRQRVARKKDM